MAHSQMILTEIAPEEELNLLEKYFKSAVFNILKELKETMNKQLKENQRTDKKKQGILIGLEMIKKQRAKQILKLDNTIIKMKNSLESFNSRLEQEEETIGELEDISI